MIDDGQDWLSPEFRVVDFARDILAMQRRIDDLESEVKRLREVERKYWQLLKSSATHSGEMVGLLLAATLEGKIGGGGE